MAMANIVSRLGAHVKLLCESVDPVACKENSDAISLIIIQEGGKGASPEENANDGAEQRYFPNESFFTPPAKQYDSVNGPVCAAATDCCSFGGVADSRTLRLQVYSLLKRVESFDRNEAGNCRLLIAKEICCKLIHGEGWSPKLRITTALLWDVLRFHDFSNLLLNCEGGRSPASVGLLALMNELRYESILEMADSDQSICLATLKFIILAPTMNIQQIHTLMTNDFGTLCSRTKAVLWAVVGFQVALVGDHRSMLLSFAQAMNADQESIVVRYLRLLTYIRMGHVSLASVAISDMHAAIAANGRAPEGQPGSNLLLLATAATLRMESRFDGLQLDGKRTCYELLGRCQAAIQRDDRFPNYTVRYVCDTLADLKGGENFDILTLQSFEHQVSCHDLKRIEKLLCGIRKEARGTGSTCNKASKLELVVGEYLADDLTRTAARFHLLKYVIRGTGLLGTDKVALMEQSINDAIRECNDLNYLYQLVILLMEVEAMGAN